jgi:hypothetical protein
MSRRGRWDRLRDRTRMRTHRVESVAGGSIPNQLTLELGPPQRRRRQPSRTELRALADAAVKAWRSRPQ